MAEGGTPTLLDLPPELRNRIWELVVFHEPTGGVICPLQDTHGQVNATSHPESMAMIAGARFMIYGRIPNFDCPRKYLHSAQASGGQAADLSIIELWRLWHKSPNLESKHFCNLNCLLQPPITHVNAQVRAESLPLFYSTNHFHFEMSNFALASKLHVRIRGKRDPKDQRTPIDWFESIRNKNLNNIARLDIVGQSLYDCEHNGILVKYDRDQSLAESAVTCGFLDENTFPTWRAGAPWEKLRSDVSFTTVIWRSFDRYSTW
jgi:hypothetical protein